MFDVLQHYSMPTFLLLFLTLLWIPVTEHQEDTSITRREAVASVTRHVSPEARGAALHIVRLQ